MKPTLIILHGWGHSAADWETVKQMLEKDIDVVTIDLPGFGKECLVNESWSIPEYAEWVKKKIADIPGNKIILGHSLGGRIASFIAASRPIWLKALILAGTPSIYRPNGEIKAKIFLAKTIKSFGIRRLFSYKNEELRDADNQGIGRIFRNAVSFDQTSLLPKINVPTMLIWGELDEAVPIRIAKEMKDLIPGSKLFIIDKVGHNAYKENTYLFYGIVKNFIKNI